MSFTHLEVHSHFTLLGASASVTELASRAAAEGLSHLALTDTNGLYGAVAFARACHGVGVRPIVGMTATVVHPDSGARGTTPGQLEPGKVVLLASGTDGYQSLCELASLIQGTAQREETAARGLTWDQLAAHRLGVICLSGGSNGHVERFLRMGEHAAAQRCLARLAGIYGEDTFLSAEIHGPEDELVAEKVIALGRQFGVPVAAVQPIYCMERADSWKLRLLEAIRRNCALSDLAPGLEIRAVASDSDSHWLSHAEVEGRFAAFPQALAATEAIVERCGSALPRGSVVWPRPKMAEGQTPDHALAELSWAGLTAKFGVAPAEPVAARLRRELAAIAEHGYAPLFLVVADIVRFSRRADIPVSTRGSVANSLVAYCSGITSVDPIANDLLFERFLNPARVDPPDIDLDFCSRRRDEVFSYVRDAYGPDHVAIVGAMNTMQPQSAVRETGKAYGLDQAEIDRIIAVLPHRWHPDPRRRDRRTVDDVISALDDERVRTVAKAAYGLVGQPDHLSPHPGGIIITPGPLTDIVPVQWSPKGFLITQYEHGDVEWLGLPKIDLLGIRALTVLSDAAELVRDAYDREFRLEDAPLDDPETADMLARGDTIGVFQCESEGARRTLRRLRARTVRDLAVANAFFKPGPSTGGMAAAFIRRYRGEERVTYLHPALEPILSSTKGVLIFQEQILRVAREIAGLGWDEADALRKGMGHFGAATMEGLRERFLAGCQRRRPNGPGFSAGQAETLWQQVMAFAGYGFNQGHATAYADVSFRSAYLKAHWPAAFLCARLADLGGFHHPAIYVAEALRLGIQVCPPHVNHSSASFTLTRDAGEVLWMGLSQVRNLRQKSIDRIILERGNRLYVGLSDLLERVDLQLKETTHLIQCGALDGLGPSRAILLRQAQARYRSGQTQTAESKRLQYAFRFTTEEEPEGPSSVSPIELAQYVEWERTVLGFPVSVHPLALVSQHLPECLPLRRLHEQKGRAALVAGVRLPGWTGGPGYYLGDGDSFVPVRPAPGGVTGTPAPWVPLLVKGRWLDDGYDTGWLQADDLTLIPFTFDAR